MLKGFFFRHITKIKIFLPSFFFLDLNQDLLADMIHRGRDHGLPTYTEVRNSCGLSLAKSFSDLNNTIDDKIINVLSRTYEVSRQPTAAIKKKVSWIFGKKIN